MIPLTDELPDLDIDSTVHGVVAHPWLFLLVGLPDLHGVMLWGFTFIEC